MSAVAASSWGSLPIAALWPAGVVPASALSGSALRLGARSSMRGSGDMLAHRVVVDGSEVRALRIEAGERTLIAPQRTGWAAGWLRVILGIVAVR